MAARLGLSGAGFLGPVLKGLAATVEITVEFDEMLDSVKFVSERETEYDLLSAGTYTSLGSGRRLWSRDIVFGTDTDYGDSGGRAIKNTLQWTITKKYNPNPEGEPPDVDVDRDAFNTDRDYSRVYDAATGTATENQACGMAWRDDVKYLYVLHNTRVIRVLDEDGDAVQADVPLPTTEGFIDPESICYLGSDRFAVLDEGSSGVRNPRIILFHLLPDETEIGETKIYELDRVDEFSGNLGAEGLAYDPVEEIFYVGTQSTHTQKGALWKVDLQNADTDGRPSQTFLFFWHDVLCSPGHVGVGAVLGDIYFSRSFINGQANNSVFCSFYEPATGTYEDRRMLVQVDIEDGTFISGFSHNISGWVCGMTMIDATEKILFCRLGLYTNYWRYEHTGNEESTVFEKQIWVKDIPLKWGLCLAGQEAQLGEAICFVNVGDVNPMARDSTFGINILPIFTDEFFRQHEYSGNRYAQTIRNWGGAATVEFWTDEDLGTPSIAEMDIADLEGYLWEGPSWGLHEVYVRLRASTGSANYVDIPGYIRFKQFECPE